MFGDEPPASLPADFTARVDGLFASGIVGIPRAVPSESCTAVRSFIVRASARPTWNTSAQHAQTVFDVSCGRPIADLRCLAMLLDEGKLSPEDDLHKFVPEMHPFDPPIRIQDMVRCRTGVWDQIEVPALVGWEIAPLEHPYTEADLLSLLAGQKTLAVPAGLAV